jgi:hypothetical protein
MEFLMLYIRAIYAFRFGGIHILPCFIPYRYYSGFSMLTMGAKTSNSKIEPTFVGKRL